MRGGDIGRTFVTDPDGTIEPVEGVKGRVAQSKDVVATTTEDLKQYHRWLEDYLASEKETEIGVCAGSGPNIWPI